MNDYQISQSTRLEWSAAFLKHGGKPYEQSGALMEPWPTWGWLYVAVQLCGVE